MMESDGGSVFQLAATWWRDGVLVWPMGRGISHAS